MAQIFMRFPEGKYKALTFSYDDGVEQDARLIEIFRKYGLKGTFNLNSALYAPEGTVYEPGRVHRRMTEKAVSELYKQEGIEVAVHAATHPWLEQMPQNMVTKELMDDRQNLERQFGCIVRGMAYPFGTYSDQVVESMKTVGIVYSRTVHSTHDFLMPVDWMRLPATCHHNDPELMNLADRFIEGVSYGRPWMFYVWGHSYEFEERDNWEVIEKFAAKMANRDDIWYATNIEIYDYQDAFKQLKFSMDGDMVFNPTAYEMWFERNGEVQSVKPGETKRLA